MNTILNEQTIKEIIKMYQEDGLGTHSIASYFKMGHKKISNILKENNIKIKSKGGQIKNEIDISTVQTKKYESDEFTYVAICKKTNIKINDPNNLSGKLTKHILENYGDVYIPQNNYQRKKYEVENGKKWYEEYFDIVKEENIKTRKCSLCDWETRDIENKSGCFELHISDNHKMNMSDYLNLFPNEISLHKTYIREKEREKDLSVKENYATCQLCGEKMKSVTNTHLKNVHNIDVNTYKLKYPNTKITSNTTSKKLSDSTKILNQYLDPTWTSKGESEVKEFLEGLGFEVVKGKNRKILNGKEVDLVIPSLKICFEYDGLYYHTEKMGKTSQYHLNKTIECSLLGYDLYHIYEDEWVKNKELVKHKIRHILNKSVGCKIGGRNVIVKKIPKEAKRVFLDEYHIQGNDKSDIFYGAFYNDIMVGIMTFNTKRNMTKSDEFEYELSRFATNYDYIISGLASKFIKTFIKEHNPKKIISFADRRWTLKSENNLYTKLGFKLDSVVKPSYYYYNSKIDKYKRFHKFSMGKNNLKKKYPDLDFTKSESQLTKELGFDRIWNCGMFKYVVFF